MVEFPEWESFHFDVSSHRVKLGHVILIAGMEGR
jgi:hypothetical protein